MKIEDKIAIYLNEGRSTPVNIDFARKFITNKCMKSLEGTPIYRGIEDYSEDYLYIDPKNSEPRISPYADGNYYNLLMSNLPSWRKYPPRNKSIICTTSIDNAEHRQEGTPYRVLPKDGSNIGVCIDGDIWASFKSVSYSLNSLNRALDSFFYDNDIKTRGIDLDYNKFLKACSIIDKRKERGEMVRETDLGYYDSMYDFFKPDNKDKFIDYLNNVLSPSSNRFELLSVGDHIHYDREVWTDGESILVQNRSELAEELFGRQHNEF